MIEHQWLENIFTKKISNLKENDIIKQDDEADKGNFIPYMDLIYRFILVRIVIALGVYVDTSFLGVKGDTPTQCK